MFQCLPLLDLKGYEPDSFSYRFLKVSTVFRHSFKAFILKNARGHMSFAHATEFG
jgi:hypothetical protein